MDASPHRRRNSSAYSRSPQRDDYPLPSPRSAAISPMLISSMSSDNGELPVTDSDEGYSVSDSGEPLARRPMVPKTPAAIHKEHIREKYPEIYALISKCEERANAGNSGREGEWKKQKSVESCCDEVRQALYKDCVALLRRNRVLERDMTELRKELNSVQAANKQIRETYVKIYAKAEQEEEYISNILLKRIQKLKNDKEALAQKYEQEEEFLTNELMRRIEQLQAERDSLEGKMKSEQGQLIDNLLATIRRMEKEVATSRKNMDRMRKEKIDQENALEHEQELLFNTLGKQMDQLNNEKRKMQMTLERAYNRGYIETEEDSMGVSSSSVTGGVGPSGAAPPPPLLPFPPLSFPLESAQLNAEILRLKAQLSHTDHEKTALISANEKKARRIAQLEAALNSVVKTKDECYNQLDEIRNTLSTRVDAAVSAASVAQTPAVPPPSRDIYMGPPSVPPSRQDYEMDDGLSRSSHQSDMN